MANEKAVQGEAATFLSLFASIGKATQPGFASLYSEESELLTLKILSRSFEQQTSELASVFRSALELAPASVVADANALVRTMGILPLIEGLPSMSVNLKGPFQKFSFAGILQLIKKLFEQFKDMLGKFLPSWLIKTLPAILEIIDELPNLKMSLNAPDDAAMLSRQHRNYLGELAALARLERELSWKLDVDEDSA